MENAMERQQSAHVGRASAGQHAQWISGRIETLLAHYFQPDNPSELLEAAIDDWIDMLLPFSQQAIQAACAEYLRTEPRRRPTPGAIKGLAERFAGEARAKASASDQELNDDEKRVAHFAASKGWMGYDLARGVIRNSRDASMPSWVTTPADRALYAVRHSEMNSALSNGMEMPGSVRNDRPF